jgi:hypothetical protein
MDGIHQLLDGFPPEQLSPAHKLVLLFGLGLKKLLYVRIPLIDCGSVRTRGASVHLELASRAVFFGHLACPIRNSYCCKIKPLATIYGVNRQRLDQIELLVVLSEVRRKRLQE